MELTTRVAGAKAQWRVPTSDLLQVYALHNLTPRIQELVQLFQMA
jgi:hypothetical protein